MGQWYGRGNPNRVGFLSRGNIAESLERSRGLEFTNQSPERRESHRWKAPEICRGPCLDL